jgi:transposase
LGAERKSDPVEARACAHFAISQRPAPPRRRTCLPTQLRTLRQVAARLQATVRQRTRLINQFHQLLALSFPELALLVKDISQGWVLELVHRYPSAQQLGSASAGDLAAIPYLPDKHVTTLLEQARSSIASLAGPPGVYRALPKANHLDTIPGIGAVTAAVLTAFILDIDRFDTPNKLVAYFGVLPVEMSSGVDRDGQPRGARRYVMSQSSR